MTFYLDGKQLKTPHRVTAKHHGLVYFDCDLKMLLFILIANNAELSYDPDVPPWWVKRKGKP